MATAFLADAATFGALAGPAWLAWRRVFYGLCWLAGSFDGARQGLTLDEKGAYELGRTHVMQTVANFFYMRFERIDWAALISGLAAARHRMDALTDQWRRGVRRDLRIARDWIARKINLPKETAQMLAMLREHGKVSAPLAGVDGAGIASDLETQRAANIAKLAAMPPGPEKQALIRQHDHVKRQLYGFYTEEPAAAALFGAPKLTMGLASALLNVRWVTIAVGIGAAGWGIVLIDQARIGHIKRDVADTKERLNYQLAYSKQVTGRLDELRTEVKAQNVRCQMESVAASDRRTVRENRVRRADVEARSKTNAAIAGGLKPFDIDSKLRDVDAPIDAAAAPAGAAAASDVAPGVLRPVAADAGAPGPVAASGDGH